LLCLGANLQRYFPDIKKWSVSFDQNTTHSYSFRRIKYAQIV
jgi:hypothetical protein